MSYDEFRLADQLQEDLGLTVCCKGSGGSSGAVDYPQYMKDTHEAWLGEMDSYIQAASSPYTLQAAYDPDADIDSMVAALAVFGTAVTALSYQANWESAMNAAVVQVDNVIDSAYIDAAVAAHSASLDDDINDSVLPQFQAGMRDINAVVNSAFVMGEARIWARKEVELSKYGAALRLELHKHRNEMVLKGTQSIIDNQHFMIQMSNTLATLTIDMYKLKIVAKKEQIDGDNELEKLDALWPLEKYQHGANLLAGIGGGTHSTTGDKPSKVQSVLGGALSGAATGAMIGAAGGPIGWAGGAILGGLGGLLS